MKVTNIRIRKILNDEKLKAVVSITFDDALCVHDIKIIENNEKIFLAMPSTRLKSGEFRDTVHPINCEFRQELENHVLHEYKKLSL